jgi:hypothetical protein
MKNLHVSSDCHNTTKFISKIIGRELIVRDEYRSTTLRMDGVIMEITGDAMILNQYDNLKL